jgi:hypothetical protein
MPLFFAKLFVDGFAKGSSILPRLPRAGVKGARFKSA